jgi:DNA polymerase phi
MHKAARIFMHHLCRARRSCHEVGPCAEALNAQVERLV